MARSREPWHGALSLACCSLLGYLAEVSEERKVRTGVVVYFAVYSVLWTARDGLAPQVATTMTRPPCPMRGTEAGGGATGESIAHKIRIHSSKTVKARRPDRYKRIVCTAGAKAQQLASSKPPSSAMASDGAPPSQMASSGVQTWHCNTMH